MRTIICPHCNESLSVPGDLTKTHSIEAEKRLPRPEPEA